MHQGEKDKHECSMDPGEAQGNVKGAGWHNMRS